MVAPYLTGVVVGQFVLDPEQIAVECYGLIKVWRVVGDLPDFVHQTHSFPFSDRTQDHPGIP